MIPLVEIAVLVRHFAPYFESVFSPEAFMHFQRYISAWIQLSSAIFDLGYGVCFLTPYFIR